MINWRSWERSFRAAYIIAFSDDPPYFLHHLLELRCCNKEDLQLAATKLLSSLAIEGWSTSHRWASTADSSLCSSQIEPSRLSPTWKSSINFLMSYLSKWKHSIIVTSPPQRRIVKIDLKDAYHNILVHPNIRKHFSFVILYPLSLRLWLP